MDVPDKKKRPEVSQTRIERKLLECIPKNSFLLVGNSLLKVKCCGTK